jgi:hypothetical protein
MNTNARELTEREIYEHESLGVEFDGKFGTHGEERRKPFGGLSESDVEQLVARVSRRVIESFYRDVGRSVVARVLQILGLLTTAAVVWLAGGKFRWWGMP